MSSKKLLILCPYPVGVAASQRLKYEQYLDDWRQLGFEIHISSFINRSMWRVLYLPGNYFQKTIGTLYGTFRRCRDLSQIARYDLVYVHMWVTPLGTTLFERAVRKFSKQLIYDIEDNVVVDRQEVRGTLHPNSLIKFLRGTGKAKFLVRYADCVITSSPFLNDYCLKINNDQNCIYISSSLDTDKFLPNTRWSRKSKVVIGWTGTFSSKIFLDSLRVVFQRLAERVEFKLKIIGNFDYELPGIDLQVETWSVDAEVEQLQGIDIGVYPLPENIWVQGKSGLKAIQYMACGLPTVASKVGTTPLLITHDVEGLLVESEYEWIDSLERLIRYPELRRRLGEAARKKAVQKYSINSVKNDYRKVLRPFLGEQTQ